MPAQGGFHLCGFPIAVGNPAPVPSNTDVTRLLSRKGAKLLSTNRERKSSGSTRNLRWRVVDIVVASVVAVAIGVIYWAWDQLYYPLSLIQAALPGLQSLADGIWMLGGVVGGLIVRKPGAALFTELLAAAAEALIGTQWGVLTLVGGLLQGLGAELVFALVLYRTWRLWVAILAGASAGVVGAILGLIFEYPGADLPFTGVYVVCATVSGAVLAGVLGWFMVRGLARTGALNRFAAGRDSRVEI